MGAVTYDRLLIARSSPQNGCLSADGEVLFLGVPPRDPVGDARYHFRGVVSHLRNDYGWVGDILDAPMTIGTFAEQIRGPQSPTLLALQEKLLKSISELEPGTPVAVDFFRRSIPTRVELVVHKVIFQR